MSRTNRIILDAYMDTMDALGAYLGEAFEIVLHELEDLDHSIVKIVNGFHSGRVLGGPITDLALSMLEQINKKGSQRFMTYYSRSKYGKPVKSTTMAIFGEHQKAIGLLCINMYLDSPLTSLLKDFSIEDSNKYVPENFITQSDELIIRALEKTKEEVSADNNILSSQMNKEIITLLFHQGIFKLKDAVRIISEDLGISKSTVYMHLKTLQKTKI
ncbi:MAG: PAS domain-containing protein [Treponema sp.]|nr:PAS domain-containing protein [Treponema sp.]